MRLQNYINEITKVSDEEVNKILDSGFINYKRIVKKLRLRTWPLRLVALAIAFRDFNITFMINNYKWLNKRFDINKDNLGQTLPIKGTPIKLIINKKELKSITSKSLRKKLFDVLVHEVIHRKQFNKMSAKFLEKYDPKHNDVTAYLAQKEEIEAYAKDAVEELKKGNSDIVDSYYGWVKDMSEVLWRRFLKRLYQYQDIYGNDKSKENLKKQLPELKYEWEDDDET